MLAKLSGPEPCPEPTIRAIVIDFSGTLARTTGIAVDWFDEVARAGGVLRPELVARYWTTCGDGQAHRRASSDRAAYRRWELRNLRAMVRAAGVRSDHGRLATRLHSSAATATYTLYADASALIVALQAATIPCVACSNFGWDLPSVLERLGIADTFAAVFVSSQVGYRKPHPLMLDVALRFLGTPPERTMMVGDAWDTDIAMGTARGLQTYHVRRRDDPCRCTDFGGRCQATLNELTSCVRALPALH